MKAIIVIIRAVTSLAQYLTDKGEHTALYKINLIVIYLFFGGVRGGGFLGYLPSSQAQ